MAKTQTTPTIVFIFGGTGDLAHRKLMPALYNLYLDHLLCNHLSVIGIGRSDYSNDSYRDYVKKGVEEFSRRKEDIDKEWKDFAQHIEYVKLDLGDDKAYQCLGTMIKKTNDAWHTEANV